MLMRLRLGFTVVVGRAHDCCDDPHVEGDAS